MRKVPRQQEALNAIYYFPKVKVMVLMSEIGKRNQVNVKYKVK